MMEVAEMHANSCGLKAYCTWWSIEALETCRRACGGHAFSAYSCLPAMLGDFGVYTTGGGDNIVLAQQLSRFLLSSWKNSLQGKPIPPSFSYLKHNLQDLGGTQIDLLDHNTQLVIAKTFALKLIKEVASQFQQSLASGKNALEAQNDLMEDLLECARAHTHILLLEGFVNVVQHTAQDFQIRKVLSQLCSLFALQHIESYTATRMLEHGVLQLADTRTLRTAIVELCKKLRVEAIGLVDAFNLPDCVIGSPLGRYDGNIYEHYFNAVKGSRGSQEVPAYWTKIVQPNLRKNDV